MLPALYADASHSSSTALQDEANGDMKIFISSLISGFEPFREAARSAIANLRHEAVMAEEFGAQPTSPQIA
jgi:hypothetical protein